jgi:HEAT repeat protein
MEVEDVELLRRTLKSDSSALVRIVAAEALYRFGPESTRQSAQDALVQVVQDRPADEFAALAALNALEQAQVPKTDLLGPLKSIGQPSPTVPKRNREYVGRMVNTLTD